MRRLRPAACACLLVAACAAGPGALPIPESNLPRTNRPPAPPAPPRDGPYDSADSRRVTLVVEVGKERVTLDAWCRVGVWTTLDRLEPTEFVIRESWGRLRERPPRRLAQIRDQAMGGVLARLRPENDGGIRFFVEVARAEVTGSRLAGVYHGEQVMLPEVRRHGYRFRGRAAAGGMGLIARWGDAIAVRLGEGGVPPGARHFRSGEVSGFVAGEAAEAFVERWEQVEPVHVNADGVERMDFRLQRSRSAAGFGPGGSYGAQFQIRGG